MLTRKKIRKTINLEFGELSHSLTRLCNDFNEENLHALRVNNKKIKALIYLLNACQANNKKLTVKKLKHLFDKAGKVRTAQLNLKIMNQHMNSNEEFEQKQHQIIKNESEKICQGKDIYCQKTRRLQKRVSFNATAIKDERLIGYYYKNLKELSIEFRPPINVGKLHHLRKIIKRLLYALKVLPRLLKKEININKNYLDELQDSIGKWHDILVTQEALATAGINDADGLTFLTRQEKNSLEAVKILSASFDIEAMYAVR